MHSFREIRSPRASRLAVFILQAAILLFAAAPIMAQPVFEKAFAPDTIGPDSTSLLTFTITNGAGSPATGLAFTDNLPDYVTIAEPGLPTTDCAAGTVTAPDGGSTISLSGASVSAFSSCTVTVQVTSSMVGTHINVSGDLTSSAGNSGPATDDLDVVTSRPGFSKNFAPASGPIGSRATLTLTIDNSANSGFASGIGFTDVLPSGLVIADPPNAVTDCSGTLTAAAGDDTISILNGLLLAGQSCSITVDVVAGATGDLHNSSGNLSSTPGGPAVLSGFATDTFASTAGRLVLIKEFLDDPTLPGETVDLEFRILNRDSVNAATNVAFTDDFAATLAGLTFDSVQSNTCGGSVTGTATTTLTFTGGSLAARSECALVVRLTVPAVATAGAYPNTTSAITADLDVPETGNAASDTLFVSEAPTVTKTFLTNPTAGGNMVTLEFTIQNNSATSSASDIAFLDSLGFLSGIVYTSGFQSGICGAGSGLSAIPTGGDTSLNFSGGNLAPSASCTFTADLELPVGTPPGDYLNTTTELTATVDGTTQTGNAATDTLTVVAAPQITKSFTDDPVLPGETVTLEFSLVHDQFSPTDATGITFTDNLDAVVSGLAATSLPMNDVCGTGSTLSGTTTLTLTGGTLAPDETCTFSVTLQVPPGALPGVFTNITSDVTATVAGITATANPAQDDLIISGLNISKEFIDDPVIAGDQTTLRFTIDNTDSTLDATGMFFTDSLNANLAGLSAVAPLPAEPCGAGSSISGTTNLVFTGGNLAAGASCNFDVTVQVPLAAADGNYSNVTSALTATIDGSSVALPPATDELEVRSSVIALSKSFTDDPVQPGNQVTLDLTLTNLDDQSISAIAFSDDLDAALSGLTLASTEANTCNFNIAGTSILNFTNGTLPGFGSCSVELLLDVPISASPGTYLNTTSDTAGMVDGLNVTGGAASDSLRVVAVSFSKSFDGPSVATGTPTLTFTITNLDPASSIGSLSFTDDLNAVIPGLVATGLPLSNICGAGSSIAGTGFLVFSGGELAPAGSAGDTCNIEVPLAVPGTTTAGGYPSTTSSLTSGGLVMSDPATATLVIEPPPAFAKVFSPNAIAVNGTTTLTFTINNSASAVAATNLDFSDNLPVGLVVASPANASATCTGGTLTAPAGAGTVSYSGGAVAAGASCTIQVDVTGATEGSFTNISGDLTSSSGTSGTATDTIDVVSGDFVVTKSFQTEPVLPAGLVNLELSIVNGSAFALTDISLTDDLGAIVPGLAAEGLPLVDVCGAGSQATGTSIVSLTGGNLPASGSCTIVIPVRVPANAPEGAFTNTTSTATGVREGVAVEADPDSADLVIEPLSFTKSLNPDIAAQDSTVNVTFTITNPDPANGVTALAFSDDLDAFVPGMTATNTPLNDSCGTGSQVTGSDTIALAGGTLSGGGSCTFQVTLQIPAATSGGFTNTTSALTGEIDSIPISVPAASDALTVPVPPAFAKAFAPETIQGGQASVLTFTIDNTGSQLPAANLDFNDTLPAGLELADTPAAATTCDGGSFSAAPGAATFGYTGGSVAAGATCTVSVSVTADNPGVFDNISGELTSALGNSGTAEATLTVVTPPGFAKSFDPLHIAGGQTSVLTLTIDNSGQPLAASDLAFTDNLPAGLILANPVGASNSCNGALTAPAGGTSLTLTAGSVGAGASCTISVGVTADDPGVFDNTTEDLTSMLGTVQANSGTASASLTVTTQPEFSKAFDPSTIRGGETSVLTLTIDNSAQPLAANDLAFTDNLPADVVLADPVGATTDCAGTLTAPPGGSTVTLSFGSIAAGETCSVSVNVESTVPGTYENITSDLTSTLGSLAATTDPAAATLTVSEDSDGVPGEIEDQAPNNGDGNNDGIPDRIQDDVASLPPFNGNGFITVAITSGCNELNNVVASSPSSQGPVPANLSFAFGVVGFEMPCENAVVDIIFAGDTSLLGDSYFKFGPTTPGQPATADWFNFSDPPSGAVTGATLSGNTWTLTLADNQLGDATGDDGVIVDPGGPVQQFLPIPLIQPLLLLLLAAILCMIGVLAIARLQRNRV